MICYYGRQLGAKGLVLLYERELRGRKGRSMLRIAVVDDELEQRELIERYLTRFAQEQHREIAVNTYCNAFDFLSVFDQRYDAVFLDIQMPDVNGIKVAEEIRATDQRVKIVFITNLGQYAVQGYAVRAMDFIVKPLEWETFQEKMLRFCSDYDDELPRFVTIHNAEGLVRLRTDRILFAELLNRKLHVHTLDGQYSVYESLRDFEKQLGDDDRFFRCHASVLVSLMYVEQVRGNSALVAGKEVPVSKQKRAAFMKALTNQLAGRR